MGWGGPYLQHGMLHIRISGVMLVFSCAVGQMGLDKSSLRHKVKTTEPIPPPPKNIIFCLLNTFFKSLATRHLLPMEESKIFHKPRTKESMVHPRAAPTWPSPQCGHTAQETCSFLRNLAEFTANNFD